MNIAHAQIRISGSMEDNCHKALTCIQEAAANGAALICFPEVQLLSDI